MDLTSYKPQFEKAIEHLQNELTSLRTNRATPSLIENIPVVAYDGSAPMSLVQLGSISVPEARQLLVEPWDQSTVHAIEKALTASDLGLSITNEGSVLRLVMPLMTDEVKKQIIKVLGTKIEETRVAVRQIRDKAKEDINQEEKNKLIGEDEKYKLIEKLDDLVKEYNDKIKEMSDKKEKEINS